MQIQKSRSEQAKFDFVSGLMQYNSTGLGKAMTEFFVSNESKFSNSETNNSSEIISDIGSIMNDASVYKFGAFFELNNHALMFKTVLDILENRRDEVEAWLDDINQKNFIGKLDLNPEIEPPTYYKNIEIHTQPGNYHGDFAGFLYHWMIGPFLVHRDDNDEMGWQLARGVPNKPYKDILDLGCGIGKSTLPYCDLYPNANVVGLDYAASMLKYGHRLAEERNKKIHFKQAYAEETGFEDESFDLVVAIWLFHELPPKARDKVVREAYRVLRPGGVFAIMESPPFENLIGEYSKLSAFLLDSTGRRMSDPFIPGFFKEDRTEMFKRGGFSDAEDIPLPNELTGWGSGDSYFFGAYPWWMTIGTK